MRIRINHSDTSRDLLEQLAEWQQLLEVARGIDRQGMVARQRQLAAQGESAPVGGQRALNAILKDQLTSRDWAADAPVFRPEVPLPSWFKLTFRKGPIGAVVSTHNRGYLPRNLLILQLAAGPENDQIWNSVETAVLLIPTQGLKDWSGMDSTVGTYEEALNAVRALSGILSAPLSIVGLDAAEEETGAWERTDVFPGAV